MGNRAVITIDKTPSENSVGIYLHWNGGAESVLAFAMAARELGVRPPDSDPSYCLAQLVRVIGNFFGNPLSLGVGRLSQLDCDNGDNGVFRVTWDKDNVVLDNWPEGKFLGKSNRVDTEAIIKHNSYWNPKPDESGEVSDTILEAVLKKNREAFGVKQPATA